ncbi:response regulator [Vaginella massiliensis]|uniref:response regulator n=1 Tax=Vaginella massiliensis TaxID=1816680 RepID=UPI0008394C00|nr:response regulator [Vaginella massiliensis]
MNKVLIIDDEEKLRNLLSKIISLEGFEVFQAPTITLELKRLESNDIDVVICDLKLPDGNGIETAKIIKKQTSRSRSYSSSRLWHNYRRRASHEKRRF